MHDYLLDPPDDARYCERCETYYEGKWCPDCAADEADRRYDERKEEGACEVNRVLP